MSSEDQKPADVKTLTYRLTTEESLQLSNQQLRIQLLNVEMEKLVLQQTIMASHISRRLGEDVSTWSFDLDNGLVTRPAKEANK